MSVLRIAARNLRKGHVLSVTREVVMKIIPSEKSIWLELEHVDDKIGRVMSYANDALVSVEG